MEENSIFQDLEIAKQQRTLINVYRIDDEIFYTGYVDYLDEQEVVLQNYDYLGMDDGMSLLKLNYISEVELESDDLDMMRDRIQLAASLNLVSVANQSLMRLSQPHQWIKEVIGRSYVDDQALMLIIFDENMNFKNLEGFVRQVSEHSFVFEVLNKNYFDKRERLTYRYSDIGVVEFLGKDLAQMTRHQRLLMTTPHVQGSVADDQASINGVLLQSLQQNQLVEIKSNLTNRYFYVGIVKAFNDRQYVLKLVDMNGQFGGYSILRRDSIKAIWLKSDYLTFIQQCIDTNVADDVYCQPILNDDREFDAGSNMMLELLGQDVQMQRFVRLQLINEDHTMVGVVSSVDDEMIYFSCFDDFVYQLLSPIAIRLDQIGEVAFEYMDLILSQRQYLDKH